MSFMDWYFSYEGKRQFALCVMLMLIDLMERSVWQWWADPLFIVSSRSFLLTYPHTCIICWGIQIHTALKWCLRSAHKTIVVTKPAQLQCPTGRYAHKMWGNRVNSLQKQTVHEQFKESGKVRDAKNGVQKYIHKAVIKHKARRRWHLLSAEKQRNDTC